MRAQTFLSCDLGPSCETCASITSAFDQTTCYAAGCYCFGKQVYNRGSCVGNAFDTLRAFYGCPQSNTPVVLDDNDPTGSNLLAITAHDLDRSSTLVEKLEVDDFAYTKTPLRPISDNPISSTLTEVRNGTSTTFTATATEVTGDDPTDPKVLTDLQAAKGVEVFFRPTRGFAETTLSVDFVGTGTPTAIELNPRPPWRLLFAVGVHRFEKIQTVLCST